MTKKFGSWMNLAVSISMICSILAFGLFTHISSAGAVQASRGVVDGDRTTSHRLIVQLKSPPAVEWAKSQGIAQLENGRMNLKDAAVQMYVQQLKVEQAAFVSAMKQVLPQAIVGEYINELGNRTELSYQLVYNGVVVEPGMDKNKAAKLLLALPGVKGVWMDYANEPDMYASLPLINAQAAWNNAAIGGKADAGKGIKIASMDGGIYGHDNKAAMFSGVGFDYPADYPDGGLGLTDNNNGKVIASRAYFRTWDPPAAGDENPWPGVNGTEHGGHTSGTMAGNEVVADYLGVTNTISGVAPAAWLMSYRVFYASVNGISSFYNAEGIRALEDIAYDQPDVLNNSWGGGPGSRGDEYDPLDEAANNAARAGIFISFSAGNAGPELGTSDHPGEDYIVVGNSTTSGTMSTGSIDVSAPTPISTTLQAIPYGVNSGWGGVITTTSTYTYVAGISINPANFEGCNAWPANAFSGGYAVVARGTCTFAVKAARAQVAGAVGVIIYSDPARRYDLINMSCSAPDPCGALTIPAYMIRYDAGKSMESWYAQHGAASKITIDPNSVKQVGNIPDLVAAGSSRGPGANQILKPDILAPGINILSHGYNPDASGEERHFTYGQAGGTSMASPHVAGSAALLRQIYPNWPNYYIKSALMSTSKYIGIYTAAGVQAQPLDMGAGRLDLTKAADPGVILSPQKASFGLVQQPAVSSLNLWVTNVAGASETYTMTAQKVATTAAWATPTVSALPGVVVSPAVLSLNANETKMITVTFTTTATGVTAGDNQGWVLMDGPTHDAHFPLWARVVPPASNEVLIIDRDACSTDYPRGCNYRPVYMNTLFALGKTYDTATSVPSAATLARYKAVIVYTGINYTGAAAAEEQALVQYANAGGKVIAMGQDLYAWTNEPSSGVFFYDLILGGEYLQDTVTDNGYSELPIVNTVAAPTDLHDIAVDTLPRDVAAKNVTLLGANEVPPVTSTLVADVDLYYFDATNYLTWDLHVSAPAPTTATGASINVGAAGATGAVYATIFSTPQVITSTEKTFSGYKFLTNAEDAILKAGGYYINVLSTANPTGDVRAQVVPAVDEAGDGWDLLYMDELDDPGDVAYTPLFQYPGLYNLEDGFVGMLHSDEPTLEKPGKYYLGSSIYTSFGLENVNNGVPGMFEREDLMRYFFDWLYDEPTGTISNTMSVPTTNLTSFQALFDSNISYVNAEAYRWDFGDGSPFTAFSTSSDTGHVYNWCGMHTVRVEIRDTMGRHVVVSQPFMVTSCKLGYPLFTPFIAKP